MFPLGCIFGAGFATRHAVKAHLKLKQLKFVAEAIAKHSNYVAVRGRCQTKDPKTTPLFKIENVVYYDSSVRKSTNLAESIATENPGLVSNSQVVHYYFYPKDIELKTKDETFSVQDFRSIDLEHCSLRHSRFYKGFQETEYYLPADQKITIIGLARLKDGKFTLSADPDNKLPYLALRNSLANHQADLGFKRAILGCIGVALATLAIVSSVKSKHYKNQN